MIEEGAASSFCCTGAEAGNEVAETAESVCEAGNDRTDDDDDEDDDDDDAEPPEACSQIASKFGGTRS